MKTKAARTIPTLPARKAIRPQPENPAERMQQVYPELRRIAAHLFKQERPEHTLQPTELVNEAFIRLCGHGPKRYKNKAHFFAVVSRGMREILVEYARRRGAKKRGGGWRRVLLEEADGMPAAEFDLVAIDAALKRLTVFDPQLCQIAELRLFGGLSTREIAADFHRGDSTVRRDWHIAKAWLQRDLKFKSEKTESRRPLIA